MSASESRGNSSVSSPLNQSVHTARGNVSQEIRDGLIDWFKMTALATGFGAHISRRLVVSEMEVFESKDEPRKRQVRVVFEGDVEYDMCNYIKNMHGGCTAYLIDLCSSIAIDLLLRHVKPDSTKHVSLVLNTSFHAPAPLGCRIKIVNTTVALGSRVMTAKTEMFDSTNERLVATGLHIKMPPSEPKL